jgi:WD40 repeat protein
MAVVYRARQLKLNRVIALKMLPPGADDDPTDVARFQSEAEAVAAVRHPHVVPVYEYGHSDGRPYFAMEFLPGGTLYARLKVNGRFPPDAAVETVEKLARAIHAAHSQGIVHRDLKPGNVLYDASGEPRVTDFGLAKRTACDLTRTQAVMGTPAYMSPEQADGRAKFAGPPADIYALGVILYECLTGATPFESDDSLHLLQRVLFEPPPLVRSKVPEVPRDLELICLKCLEKEPADRYQSAAALADDLARFRNREPVSVRPAGAVERLVKWVRRRPTAAAAYGLAAAVAFLILFGGGLLVLWRRAVDAGDRAAEHRREVEQARDELQVKNGELAHAHAEQTKQTALAEAARDELREQKGKVEQALAGETAAKRAAEQAQEELAATSYFHKVGFAFREAQDGNFVRAQQLLDDCPTDRRGWEWWHAYRNAHQEAGSGQCALMAVDIAFPEERKVAICRVDGLATVYDFSKGAGVDAPLKRNTREVLATRLSIDGRRMLRVLRRDPALPPVEQVTVWEVATGKKLAGWEGANEYPNSLSLSDDGRRVFVQFDREVRCWDVDTGQQTGRLPLPKNVHFRVEPNPDGSAIALIDNPRVAVWDGRSDEPSVRLTPALGWLVATAISPDQQTVVVGDRTGALAFHHRKTKSVVRQSKAHAGPVNVIRFSPTGEYVATAGEDGAVRVWAAATGNLVKTFLGHHRRVLAVRFDPTGQRLVSSDEAFLFLTWAMKEQFQPRYTYVIPNAPAGLFAADRDLQRVFAAGDPPSVRGAIHPYGGGTPTPVAAPKGQSFTAFGFSPVGPGFATGGGGGRVEWWAGPDATPVHVGDLGSYVHTVRFTTDGKRMLAASGGRWLVWDATERKVVGRRESRNDGVVLSADGRTVAAAEWYDLVLYPADGDDPPRKLGLPGVITAVAFSPDGKRVFAATDRKEIREYDLTDPKLNGLKPLRVYRGHTAGIQCMAFNGDGRRLVSGAADGSVKVWDTSTGREAIGLSVGSRDAVTDVWFDGDGQNLVAVPRDRPPVIFDGRPRYLAYKPQ